MHHFVTEMCTHVHISVTKWCIVGYRTGAFARLVYWLNASDVTLNNMGKSVTTSHNEHKMGQPCTQATGLDSWASRVKCPARFVSHLHEICIYMYIWFVYSLCFFYCLFITVTWWYVWCIEWASGNQEEVQACLVTVWLFIISCYSLYKTTLGLLCSWFENNPHFHKYSMDFHV